MPLNIPEPPRVLNPELDQWLQLMHRYLTRLGVSKEDLDGVGGGGVSDHTLLSNIGVNTHEAIDDHIDGTTEDHTQYLLADGTRECTGQQLFVTGLKVQQSGAGTNEVTIIGNTLMAAGITLTLPAALPGSTLPLLLSATGGLSTAELTSSHLATGSVDTDELAADSVTSAKIADDQVDSEHYVDGSVDAQHCNFVYPLMEGILTTAVSAGSTSTFVEDSRTSANFRVHVPSGTTWYVLGVTATIATGVSAGTYTVNVGVAEYSTASSATNTPTQLLEITTTSTSARVPGADMSGTIASPLMTITGASEKEVRLYIENEGTSPGALGTTHTVTIYGFVA